MYKIKFIERVKLPDSLLDCISDIYTDLVKHFCNTSV